VLLAKRWSVSEPEGHASYRRQQTATKYNRRELLTSDGRILYASHQKGGNSMQAYCVKCRAKREMKDAKAITMKNGKPATQGMCPVCGTKMFRIGKS